MTLIDFGMFFGLIAAGLLAGLGIGFPLGQRHILRQIGSERSCRRAASARSTDVLDAEYLEVKKR